MPSDLTTGIQKAVGPYPGSVAAGALIVTDEAGDVTGSQFVLSGDDLILMRNDHASVAQTVTIAAQPDAQNRSVDIDTYSIPAGETHHFRAGVLGWADVNGKITITPSTVDVKIAVIRL